GNLL
ncbi:rhs element Vgr family protein, partial [Escherichia coli 3006]